MMPKQQYMKCSKKDLHIGWYRELSSNEEKINIKVWNVE